MLKTYLERKCTSFSLNLPSEELHILVEVDLIGVISLTGVNIHQITVKENGQRYILPDTAEHLKLHKGWMFHYDNDSNHTAMKTSVLKKQSKRQF